MTTTDKEYHHGHSSAKQENYICFWGAWALKKQIEIVYRQVTVLDKSGIVKQLACLDET